jgi:hypothetical protein
VGQPRSSGVPAALPRAGYWQPALGALVAFAGGIATEVAAILIGNSTIDSTILQLLSYGAIVLVASLTGGALFRSRWAALAVPVALMLGIVTYIVLAEAFFGSPYAVGPGAVDADIRLLAFIVEWAGLPAAVLAALASALRRRFASSESGR